MNSAYCFSETKYKHKLYLRTESLMQRLTDMHESHAPESPPCLPGVVAALRVRYHHLVSSGCNPSPIPPPPTAGLSQIRDKNSGECF